MTEDEEIVDLLVIGGGINGCGIACDAAGRGLRVALVEQGDLGGATSSASLWVLASAMLRAIGLSRPFTVCPAASSSR